MKANIMLLALVFCLGVSCNSFSQHLARRPFLGVQITPVTDSLALAYRLNSTDGAWVRQVIPASTAATLKLKPDDIILQVNTTQIKEFRELPALAREFNTGDPVALTLVRQGKKLTLEGKVQPLPLEKDPKADVLYGEVSLGGGGFARSIMKKPKGKGKFPAVFYIQGFSCASIDNLPDKDSQKLLIDGLVAQGFAVFRMEKPGVGDTKGTQPCPEIGYQEEKNAFASGLRQLKQYAFIDTENVFLFGHSLGANTAPLIAAEEKVKGIISYGVAGKPWLEYLIELSREQRTMVGGDYVETDERMQVAIPFLYEYLVLKKTPQELEKNPAFKAYMENSFGYDGNGHMMGRHYSFLQELQDMPMIKAWRDAQVYALTIYGEADLQALDPEGAKFITDLVNSYHPGKGTYKFLPQTDHGFIKVGTKQEYQQLRETGAYGAFAQDNFNHEIVAMVTAWIKDKLKKT